LADSLKKDIKDMPFAFASPEWSNEKGVGAALGFRLLGINSYHSVYPPVQGSKNVMKYLFEDTEKNPGSCHGSGSGSAEARRQNNFRHR